MFDPKTVEIKYALSYDQVNLILEGLGKLPFERVESLYTGIRLHAAETMRAAELSVQSKQVAALEAQPPEGGDA